MAGQTMQIQTELERQAVLRGITREALSDAIGKTVKTAYNLMRGRSPITLQDGIKLSELFKERPEIILKWQQSVAQWTQANA